MLASPTRVVGLRSVEFVLVVLVLSQHQYIEPQPEGRGYIDCTS